MKQVPDFGSLQLCDTFLTQVVPVFPPFDLPTWTSLATGRYPQNTGVVGDYMYNLQNKQMFNRDDDLASLDGWWTEGEPIWFVIILPK